MLLKTIEPGEATGRLKEIYDLFPPEVGVPRTLRLYSASPELLNRQFGFISYFREHPRLSPEFSAALRYSVAVKANHTACEIFNRGVLRRMGLNESEIAQLTENNVEKPMEPAEQALLDFVLKAVDSPASVARQDIEELKNLGYEESDILDAMVMAGNMVGSSLVWRTFGKD